MHKATHVLIGSFYRDNRGIAETFARPFGVGSKVPSSWGRPKASDLNPTGTGNSNPLDGAERLIRLVYAIDPARAREMADNFPELVDEMDLVEGAEVVRVTESANGLYAKTICEAADIAEHILNGQPAAIDLEHAMKEIREAESALAQLKGAIQELQKVTPS